MLKIRVDDYDDIAIFLRDEKDAFFHAIITAIKTGLEEKLNVVSVAEFAITNSDSIINIDIDEEDWPESLYLALYHYEDTEEYEKCIELKELIKHVVDEED